MKGQFTGYTCALALLSACATSDQSTKDRTPALIAEAYDVARKHGDDVWISYYDEPFRILLVEAERERLFCSQSVAPAGFIYTGKNITLGCDVYERPSQFNPGFLATFPLQDGIPTVVVGTPEATGKSDSEWIVTLLHEHFHQLQYECADYTTRTLDLGISNGDETGMWMLNYPFPYSDERVGNAARAMAFAAADAIEADERAFGLAIERYRQARNVFRAAISDDDLAYYDFQAWQEGTARFVERSFAASWPEHDSTTFSEQTSLASELRSADLATDQRTAFYPLGAAEALMLERRNPRWKASYCDGPLSLAERL